VETTVILLFFFRCHIKKNKGDEKNASGEVKKQIANCCFVEIHTYLLTIQIANIHKPIANPNPNSKTVRGGLSSDGIRYGTTREPKNNCPRPKDKSENLSS